MSTIICIPARIGSTRIKEKMLIEFNGVPLITQVFKKVETFGYDTVVLTDSQKIANLLPKNNVILTSKHENGTSRVASVLDQLKYDNYLNIQGDMLGITKSTVEPILNLAESTPFSMITAYKKHYNPQGVKVIHQNGLASWFTRCDIGYGDQHLGIYMYKGEILENYHKLKGADGGKENLEQLRILNNFPMHVVESQYEGREINCKEDIYVHR